MSATSTSARAVPSTGRRLAPVLGWSVLAICVALYAYYGLYVPFSAAGYDFTGPYEAAYALAHHANFPLYDVAQQRLYSARVLHLPDHGPSDFRWTPPTAVLLLPLGYLPYAVAHVIWVALNQLVLALTIVVLARCVATCARALPARLAPPLLPLANVRVAGLALFCGVALSEPVTDGLRMGQSTPFLLLGLALLLYDELLHHPILAGCGLALAITDKLFPAALLVYLLWRGRYRLCAITLGCIGALVALTFPLTGLGLYRQFLGGLLTYQNEPNAGPVNLSLYHALIVGLSALLRPGQLEPAHGPLNVAALLACLLLFGAFLVAQGVPLLLRTVVARVASGETSPPARARRSLSMRGEGWPRTSHRTLPATVRYTAAAWRTIRPPESPAARLLATGWAICALLALEPITWLFYYLLLLIPLTWLLVEGTGGASRGLPRERWWWRAGCLAYLAATVPLPLDPRTAVPMSAAYLVGICWRPAALLALWLVLGRFTLWRSRGVVGLG